jgi:hypothetical protein
MKGSGQNWKSKYIKWYRVIEKVLGTYVPRLSDEEILRFVSDRDWIIIPLPGETDKNKAKFARRPNLYFALPEDGTINFGIVYEKLGSVEQLRNIILPYNERERNDLIAKLATLDNSFVTTVNKKIKEHHPQESPNYKETLTERTNRIDLEKFNKIFREVDKILDQRELLENKKKYQLAPTVGLVYGETDQDEKSLTEALLKIKPIYELTVKARTEEQFEVCKDCLCFMCDEKEEHDCRCPCPGYPKSPSITTLCNLKGEG